jgi:hypothetical protein
MALFRADQPLGRGAGPLANTDSFQDPLAAHRPHASDARDDADRDAKTFARAADVDAGKRSTAPAQGEVQYI